MRQLYLRDPNQTTRCYHDDFHVLRLCFIPRRLAEKDRQILTMAQQEPFGFCVETMQQEQMDVMFANDPGDEDVRRTVHVYRFSLPL